jgi:hypothetical protein
MRLSIIPEIPGKPKYAIPVKYQHSISGTRGMLRIYSDKVIYETSTVVDSRYWRIEDIGRFSQPDRFRFEIVSHVPHAGGPNEACNFLLMEDLPEGVYDYLWVRLHDSTDIAEENKVAILASKSRQSMARFLRAFLPACSGQRSGFWGVPEAALAASTGDRHSFQV